MTDFAPPTIKAKLRVQATLVCKDKDGNVLGEIPIDATDTIDLTTEDQDGTDDRQLV